MLIQVFGTGCAKCQNVENTIKAYINEHGINATVEKVTDIAEMMKAGIMNTPAVVIDGAIKLTGRIPTEQDMAAWFS